MAVDSVLSAENQALIDQYIANNYKTEEAPKTASASALGGLADTFDTFLKMLVAQMQNQDPLSPMDSAQFTQQLVSFSGVEQQIAANKNLEALIALNQKTGVTSMLGYMGKFVEVGGDSLPLQDKQATFAYNLPSPAQTVTVYIKDERGANVATLNGAGGVGSHVMNWNGLVNNTQLPDGVYSFEINAVDAAGNKVTPTGTTAIGKVTGLQNGSDGGVIMLLSGLPVYDTNILAVSDSRPNL